MRTGRVGPTVKWEELKAVSIEAIQSKQLLNAKKKVLYITIALEYIRLITSI